jgi:hypothetical protein
MTGVASNATVPPVRLGVQADVRSCPEFPGSLVKVLYVYANLPTRLQVLPSHFVRTPLPSPALTPAWASGSGSPCGTRPLTAGP